jgi:hypothetical protein
VRQRRFRHRLLADRLVEGGGHAVQDRQRAAGALQHATLVVQLGVHAQGLGVGGDQQFVDLAPFGGHEFERTVGRAQRAILQDAAQARAHLHAVVGLAHETVGARLERPDDVVQAGQPGQQHDRNVGVERVVLQRTAQGKAIHAGHGDVADDQMRSQARHVDQRRRAIRGNPHTPARLAGQQARQMLRLGGTVFHDQDLDHGHRRRSLCLGYHLLCHTDRPDTCHIGR